MARSSLLGTAPVPHADEGSECGLTNNERKGFGFPAETVDDYATGVVLQAGYRSELSFQQPKVLSYDPVKLFSPFGPWRALCSPKTRRATVFSAAGLAWKHFSFFTIALVAGGSVGPLANQEAEDALENLNTIIAGGLFFLLGPFVGTACARMWSVRTSGVGALWGTVLNLSVLAAAWFHTGSVADRSARDLIKRLGLASHALLYKEARGEDNLDDLVHAGLLLPEEAQALAPLPSKGQVVWSWLTHFWARVLSGELDVTPVPHAATLQPMIMQKCLNGQDAIGTALTYIGCQQPYPYVHLLSLITSVSLFVNALATGIHTGRHVYHADGDGLTLLASQPLNACSLIACAALRVSAFTVIFSGLTAMGSSLDNPLGDDPSDLPGVSYSTFIKDGCEAWYAGVDRAVAGAWWEGLGVRHSQSKARRGTGKDYEA